MTDQNPITPPIELVQQWEGTAYNAAPIPYTHHIARCAARWGADQELEACCLLLDSGEHAATYGCHDGTSLRAARRPKPPSLKEQALEALDRMDQLPTAEDQRIIRRALEALPA